MRILVTRRIHPDAVALLRESFEVDAMGENRPLDPGFLNQNVHLFDGILSTVSERWDAQRLALAAPRLKVLSNMAAGMDNIDLEAAARLGIQVFNAPEATVDSTADMTLAIALGLIRKVASSNRFIHEAQWKGWDPEIFLGRTIRGLVWGLYGFGRIAQAVAQRAAAFGAAVIFYDPYLEPGKRQAGVPGDNVDFSTLLSRSDILSLHAPLTTETTGVFDRVAFAAMKPDAYFINMARGPLVISGDLLATLKQGNLGGAALDVFDPEPLPADHEILGLENIVVTPHIGTATHECRRDMALQAARNLITFFNKGPR